MENDIPNIIKLWFQITDNIFYKLKGIDKKMVDKERELMKEAIAKQKEIIEKSKEAGKKTS